MIYSLAAPSVTLTLASVLLVASLSMLVKLVPVAYLSRCDEPHALTQTMQFALKYANPAFWEKVSSIQAKESRDSLAEESRAKPAANQYSLFGAVRSFLARKAPLVDPMQQPLLSHA